MHAKEYLKFIRTSCTLLTCAFFASLLTNCSPAFDSTSAYKTISDENAAGALIYEDVDSQGRILSKTILEAPTEPIDQSRQEKSSKSAMKVLEGDSVYQHIGVVFVGDGYTQQDMAQYAQDVSALLKNLAAEEPFKSYRGYFTFYRVDYTSPQSGVNTQRSSGLGMHYNCNGLARLLCVSTPRVMNEARNAPRSDIVFAIANSAEYGGAGYRNPSVATLAARNPASLDLALHEVGHSFARLGDEYEEVGTGTACNSYPNISNLNFAEMQKAKQKWHRWLDVKEVSSYLGACYSSKFYRPLLESKMRNLTAEFGAINIEQFIQQIYRQVRPIKYATRTQTIKSHMLLQVEPMRPSSHNLQIDWYLDGAPLVQLQNKALVDTRTIKVTKKSQRLSVIVTDPTPAVRDEEFRHKYMRQSLEWTLKLL